MEHFPIVISGFCGFLLLALVMALIFSPSFRSDVLGGEGEATVLGILSVKGVAIVLLCGLFLGGLLYPLSTLQNSGPHQNDDSVPFSTDTPVISPTKTTPKVPPGRLLVAAPFRARLIDCALTRCEIQLQLKGFDAKGRLRYEHTTGFKDWFQGDFVDTNFGTPEKMYFEHKEKIRFEFYCRSHEESAFRYGGDSTLDWSPLHEGSESRQTGYAVWLECGREKYKVGVGIGVGVATRRVNEPNVK